jgi:hypothetical protein
MSYLHQALKMIIDDTSLVTADIEPILKAFLPNLLNTQLSDTSKLSTHDVCTLLSSLESYHNMIST